MQRVLKFEFEVMNTSCGSKARRDFVPCCWIITFYASSDLRVRSWPDVKCSFDQGVNTCIVGCDIRFQCLFANYGSATSTSRAYLYTKRGTDCSEVTIDIHACAHVHR